ncbi:hypothetical protein PspLS_01731 [Pyricularia sp. CBS 133598]|nr:hypothetical protein PspLS_01731 [Pyricularia sp. CBS 133598]
MTAAQPRPHEVLPLEKAVIDPHLRIRRAIRADDALLVRRILRSHPNLLHNPDLNGTRDEAGNSNLHLAAKLGHVEIVRLLLSLGHESHTVGPALNEQHQTALMLAAAAGHTEVVHAIAEADPSVIHRRDSRGRDAVMEAALGGHDTCLQILLTYVPGGAYEAVRQADLEGNTALHYASSKGNMLVLRTLLAAGADADRRNVWLWTAVEYSQSVQSEVYLKNLIADMEKRRASKREAVRDERIGTSGFPYPAVKCIIGQYFLSIASPRRYWAWLIVCGFFDADNNEIWHKEIFISQDCERGYSHSTGQYDNGPLPPRWAALGQLPHPSDDLSNIRIRGYKVGQRTYDIINSQVVDVTRPDSPVVVRPTSATTAVPVQSPRTQPAPTRRTAHPTPEPTYISAQQAFNSSFHGRHPAVVSQRQGRWSTVFNPYISQWVPVWTPAN